MFRKNSITALGSNVPLQIFNWKPNIHDIGAFVYVDPEAYRDEIILKKIEMKKLISIYTIFYYLKNS